MTEGSGGELDAAKAIAALAGSGFAEITPSTWGVTRDHKWLTMTMHFDTDEEARAAMEALGALRFQARWRIVVAPA